MAWHNDQLFDSIIVRRHNVRFVYQQPQGFQSWKADILHYFVFALGQLRLRHGPEYCTLNVVCVDLSPSWRESGEACCQVCGEACLDAVQVSP